MTDDAREPVAVTVPADAPEGVAEAIGAALEQVAEELAIPARIALSSGSDHTWTQSVEGLPHVVAVVAGRAVTHVGDHRLRMGPEAAAAGAAVNARELLLTPAVGDRLVARWGLGALGATQRAIVGRLLRRTVRAAIPVTAADVAGDHLRAARDPADDTVAASRLERDLEILFEEAIAPQHPPTAVISVASVNRPDHAPDRRDTAAVDGPDVESRRSTDDVLAQLRDGVFALTGVPVGLRVVDGALTDGRPVRLQLGSISSPPIDPLPADTCLVAGSPGTLAAHGIDAEPTRRAGVADPLALVSDADAERCAELGFAAWTAAQELLLELRDRIVANATATVRISVVRGQLAQLEPSYPTLVAAARELVGPMRLTAVVRALVDGGASVRDLPRVLDRLLQLEATTSASEAATILVQPASGDRYPVSDGRSVDDLTAGELADVVRRAVGTPLGNPWNSAGALPVLVVDEATEALIRRVAPTVPLVDAGPLARLLAAVDRARRAAPGCNVLLVTEGLRDPVHALLHPSHPDLQVLGFSELRPDTQLHVAGRVELT
jgi:hypothetical protein